MADMNLNGPLKNADGSLTVAGSWNNPTCAQTKQSKNTHLTGAMKGVLKSGRMIRESTVNV